MQRLDKSLQAGIDEALARAWSHHLACKRAIVVENRSIPTLTFAALWSIQGSLYEDFYGVKKARKRLEYLRGHSEAFVARVSELLENSNLDVTCTDSDALRRSIRRLQSVNDQENTLRDVIVQVHDRVLTPRAAAAILRRIGIKHATSTSVTTAVQRWVDDNHFISVKELKETRGRPPKISKNCEEQLVCLIIQSQRDGLMPSPLTVAGWADTFYRSEHLRDNATIVYRSWDDVKYISKQWAHRFVKRNSGKWNTVVPRSHDRCNYATLDALWNFYDGLGELLVNVQGATTNPHYDPQVKYSPKYLIKPGFLKYIWSCDETNMTVSLAGKKRKTPVFKVEPAGSSLSYNAGTHGYSCSAMGCRNAAGGTAPPMFVTKSKVSAPTQQLFREAIPGARWLQNAKGSFDAANFIEFLKHLREHATEDPNHPIILLYDGVRTHLTAEVLQTAKSLNILPSCLPPHTTHLLQGEDVHTFGILKRLFTAQKLQAQDKLTAVLRRLGCAHTRAPPQGWFWEILSQIWLEAFSEHNNLQGWRRQGVAPELNMRQFYDHRDWWKRMSSETQCPGELTADEALLVRNRLTLAGAAGLATQVDEVDPETSPIDGSYKNLDGTIQAIHRTKRARDFIMSGKLRELHADANQLEEFSSDVLHICATVDITAKRAHTGCKRRRENAIIAQHRSDLSHPDVLAALHDEQRRVEERRANKRARKTNQQMALERRDLAESIRSEYETNGNLAKKLTKVQMHHLLRGAGVQIEMQLSAGEHRELMRAHLPDLAQASDAAPDGRRARRIDRELSYSDSETETDEEDAESQSEDAPQEPAEENREVSPAPAADDFGLGCSRCRWNGGCNRCHAWYDAGRRRIAEREWSRGPAEPRVGE